MRTWIKLYTEILRDPKMGRLTDRQYRTAINLFLLAGDIDDDGYLGPLDEIAWSLRTPENDLLEDLKVLEEVGIVYEDEDNIWTVRKWAERQEKAPSAQREAVRERVKNWRAKPKPCNEDVTTLHAGCNEDVTTLEKKRIDKNREEVDPGAASQTETPSTSPDLCRTATPATPAKKAKTIKTSKPKEPPDPRVNEVMNRVQAGWTGKIQHWATHASEVKVLLRDYTVDEIVDCWLHKIQKIGGKWVRAAYVAEDIADWKAGRLNGNGQYRTKANQNGGSPPGETTEEKQWEDPRYAGKY